MTIIIITTVLITDYSDTITEMLQQCSAAALYMVKLMNALMTNDDVNVNINMSVRRAIQLVVIILPYRCSQNFRYGGALISIVSFPGMG